MYSITLNTQHRIAPSTPRTTVEISIGNVASPDKPDSSVNDHDLTVITVVHLIRKERETHFKERLNVDSLATHTLKEFLLDIPTTDTVINHTHLDALPRLLYKNVTQRAPELIILKDIKLYVHMLFGALYLIK